MRLDQLSLVLRQRNPWEAIDLGFAMTREWWRETYTAWLAVFVPVSAAACLLLPPQLAFLLIWWLKPALDRVPLHVLASRVFGSRPRLRDTLRSFFSYARNGLLSSLVPLPWFRFSLSRSFGLPIRQLENSRGHAARIRGQQLRKRVWNHAMWLTLACLLFEGVVFFSLIGLYDLLVPAASADTFDPFEMLKGKPHESRAYLLVGLYLAAIALIEPLYVAGGFALYLARRTQLEGWDLEVQLRRSAQRTDQPDAAQPVALSPGVAALLVVVSCTVAFLFAVPAPSSAQSESAAPHYDLQPGQDAPARLDAPHPSQSAKYIKEVLEQPQFQEFEMQTRIEPLHKSEPTKPKPSDLAGLASFMQFIAEILRAAAWVLLAAVLLFALYWVLRRLNWVRIPDHSQWTPPSTLFGLDVRHESLPDDVAAAAAQLARLGDLLGALSLLYRGALVTLLHRDRVELAGGDTEADCLIKTRERLAMPTYSYFARLLTAWQAAAYAHRIPLQLEVEQLASEWPGFFGAAA